MKNKLYEINKKASENASTALSKLTDSSVSVNILTAEIKNIESLASFFDQEAVVAGVYLPVTGDLKGASLLMLPQKIAFRICDILARRVPGTTRKLTEFDESALKELGNIISGNYLGVLANSLQAKIVECVPKFSFDMFGAITSQIITEFAQSAEKALVIELEFIFKPDTFKIYFLLLFEIKQFEDLIIPLEKELK